MLSSISRTLLLSQRVARPFSTSVIAAESVIDSAKDMAKDLADKANRGAGEAVKTAIEVGEKARDAVVESTASKSTQDMASDALAQGKKMARAGKDQVDEATTKGKAAVHDAATDAHKKTDKATSRS